MTSGLPRKFALAGVAIGVTFVLSWWFVITFNPFHLPNVDQVTRSFRKPLLLSILEGSYFVLCPGTLLQIFTIGVDGWIGWVISILTGPLLNAPIYYVVGSVVSMIMKRGSGRVGGG